MTREESAGGNPPALAPHEAAHLVIEMLAFTIQLAALGSSGALRAEMFPPYVLVLLGGSRLEIAGKPTADGLRDKLANPGESRRRLRRWR
jgi:hypothetical protein